jgi:hypothetical protein
MPIVENIKRVCIANILINGAEVKMKKIAFVMIVAALCMSPVIASAGDNGWKNFHGAYEMIASGSCMHSQDGWKDSSDPSKSNLEAEKPPFYPVDPLKVYVGTTVAYGTWTFNKDGTGTYTITNYATILPGSGFYSTTKPFLLQQGPSAPFTFTVSPFGDITVTTGNTTIGIVELVGNISNDKKIMTLISANQVQDLRGFGLYWTVCNTARTLIKVDD